MFVCTMCVPDACRSQKKAPDPQDLELQLLQSPRRSWESNLVPPEEQPVLTAESSLQPQSRKNNAVTGLGSIV